MRAQVEFAEKPRQAITDVYDQDRHTFLIQYPVPFVVGIALVGVVVLSLTGFLGYPHQNSEADAIFNQPWALYLWACALVITLEVSILRHKRLGIQRFAALSVTIISMIIVLITFFYQIPFQNLLNDLIQQIFNLRIPLVELLTSTWIYTIINFGLLLIFAVDSGQRWRRRARGLPPNAGVDLGLGEPVDSSSLPTMQQLVSGDILAGALLCGVLALLLRSDVVGLFWQVLRANVHVTGCTVSWPIGTCTPPGGGRANPPTLTFVDSILALTALPIGLLVLALTASISGFSALLGVKIGEEESQADPAIRNESSTQAVSQQVSQTIFDTIVSALHRWSGGKAKANPAEVASQSLLLSLRNVLWPPLIFLGVVGVAQFASYAQSYMHSEKTLLDELRYVGPLAIWIVVAVLCIVFALALLVFHGRVAENSLRFAGLIGFVGLLTLWIYSLALWSLNQLLLRTGASDRHPFDPPAWNSAISFGALLIFGILFIVRRIQTGTSS
ncbi:MAG: hypothetical protein ACLQUY_11640 [Ktedonobacterales bacterium]